MDSQDIKYFLQQIPLNQRKIIREKLGFYRNSLNYLIHPRDRQFSQEQIDKIEFILFIKSIKEEIINPINELINSIDYLSNNTDFENIQIGRSQFSRKNKNFFMLVNAFEIIVSEYNISYELLIEEDFEKLIDIIMQIDFNKDKDDKHTL